MVYLGCDPGVSGALAVIRDGNAAVIPFSEPDYLRVMGEVLTHADPAVCCLEHVSAMPGQGVTSMFNFGRNFGWIQGVLQTNLIPYELVRPQKWKKEFGITADKNKSIEVAHRLFPGVSLLRTPKCRKEDDGMAEALLLALYAERHF